MVVLVNVITFNTLPNDPSSSFTGTSAFLHTRFLVYNFCTTMT